MRESKSILSFTTIKEGIQVPKIKHQKNVIKTSKKYPEINLTLGISCPKKRGKYNPQIPTPI